MRMMKTRNSLSKREIYASKIIPFWSLWKGSLGRHDHLISIEYIDRTLYMSEIELSEKIIEKEDDGEIEVFTQEKYLDLLQCKEEHLGLATREHHRGLDRASLT
jgi:hypothetical protein